MKDGTGNPQVFDETATSHLPIPSYFFHFVIPIISIPQHPHSHPQIQVKTNWTFPCPCAKKDPYVQSIPVRCDTSSHKSYTRLRPCAAAHSYLPYTFGPQLSSSIATRKAPLMPLRFSFPHHLCVFCYPNILLLRCVVNMRKFPTLSVALCFSKRMIGHPSAIIAGYMRRLE